MEHPIPQLHADPEAPDKEFPEFHDAMIKQDAEQRCQSDDCGTGGNGSETSPFSKQYNGKPRQDDAKHRQQQDNHTDCQRPNQRSFQKCRHTNQPCGNHPCRNGQHRGDDCIQAPAAGSDHTASKANQDRIITADSWRLLLHLFLCGFRLLLRFRRIFLDALLVSPFLKAGFQRLPAACNRRQQGILFL